MCGWPNQRKFDTCSICDAVIDDDPYGRSRDDDNGFGSAEDDAFTVALEEPVVEFERGKLTIDGELVIDIGEVL
jgi:hypothetical protein